MRALLALGYHLEVSEADYEGAGERLPRRSTSRSRPATCRRRSSCTPRSPSSPIYRGDWEAAERETDASQTLAEREGLAGKLCFPYSMRGVLLWHEGELDEAAEMLERAFEIAEQVGRSEVAFESLPGSRARCATAATTPTPTRRSPARSTSASAPGLVAQSVEATAAAPSTLAIWGKAETRPARPPRRPPASPSACATRSAGPRASRRAAPPPATRRARALLDARRGGLGRALGRPIDAERCAALEPRRAERTAPLAVWGRRRLRRAVDPALGQALRLVLAQEALEQALVALLVAEDRDHHVLGDRVDAVGLLDDPAVVLDRARTRPRSRP